MKRISQALDSAGQDAQSGGLPRLSLPHQAKVVIAPDSFKGTIDAAAAASALARGWSTIRRQDRCDVIPMADGGEGTLAIVTTRLPAARILTYPIEGPDGAQAHARCALLPNGTAVVELAATSGLPMMRRLNAARASTYGLGEVLARLACLPEVRKLLIGLGGSATTDGGAGALQALGARLLDMSGRELDRGGVALRDLAEVDLSGLVSAPPDGVQCLVDVTAPLLGPEGAAAQFGPQKGASAAEVALLEGALTRWAQHLGGQPMAPGAGSAGGTAYGLVAGWGASINSGAEAIADLVDLGNAIKDADLLITGEGCFDQQSMRGKVVGHALRMADEYGVPSVVVAGSAPSGPQRDGRRVISLTKTAGSTDAAMEQPATWLHECGRMLALEAE